MTTQGTSLLNTDWINTKIAEINLAGSCNELQELTSEVMGEIADAKAAISTEIEKFQALLALLTPPTVNLSAIVTWITHFINDYLAVQFKPAVTYSLQLAELDEQVNRLHAAIDAAKAKFPACSINTSSP